MHAFLMVFQIMGPLLALMLCPVWLPLLGMLIGKIADLVTGRGKREAPPAPREPAAAVRAGAGTAHAAPSSQVRPAPPASSAERRRPAHRREPAAPLLNPEPAEAANRTAQ
ncbi:hypothetical protein [Amycolatopsis benzoatilytica]|uniref:hypothetical protein n=1 Tax=Amycolatopsis benzoatilytica TaxID=346045 RepID=UPI00035C5AAB|nr:hypothetical protein [Amycolatopsis benzoatilytica]